MAPRKHKGANSIENLYAQKNIVMTNITRMKTSIEEKTISFSMNQLQCRLEILNCYIDDAMDIQSEIEVLQMVIGPRWKSCALRQRVFFLVI